MMQTWDMRGYPMHDSKLIKNKQRELHAIFDEAGYTGVVATNTEQEFSRYLKPGDQVTCETTIESISEEKATALGIGYFVVTRSVFTDQDGQEVGWLTFRVLKFKPANAPQAAADDAGSSSAMAGKPKRIRSPEGPDNGWWWQGFREGKLLIQKCSDCGVVRHPPRPMCGECQSIQWEAIHSTGIGTVYSYVVMHYPEIPPFDYPNIVGLVELEEGTRVVSNLVGVNRQAVTIGMPVEVEFREVEPGFHLHCFRPVE